MTRYMADATDCTQFRDQLTITGEGTVPVPLRAGYINGAWPTATQCRVDATIDVNGSRPDADILDIERGDATPDTAPGWVRDHNARNTGFPAILYCNRTTITAVADALDAAGLNNPGRDFWWWISTATPSIQTVPDMTGVLAVQAWFSPDVAETNVDVSIVYNDAWKAPTPPPPPPPPPAPPVPVEESTVFMAHVSDNGDVFVVGEFSYRHVPDIPTYAALQKAYPVKEFSRDEWNITAGEIDARRADFLNAIKAADNA